MLREHAESEMRRAGLYDADADSGPGAIAKNVLELIQVFASQGHSGGSAMMTIGLFEKLVRFQPLTPITSDPAEWMEVIAPGANVRAEPTGLWQNRRKPSSFSRDGGKTWYDLDDPKEG
jgi:hypothetical protein